MDKLLVDIDQVLDDLEESEKHQAATNYAFSQSNCLSLKDEISSIQNQSLHHSGDQPNDQSTPKRNRLELTNESRSIGTSASVAAPSANDSIYESNFEPAYESFRNLNLIDGSSSPGDERSANVYSEKSSSNHDKSSDISANSTDKSSTNSSNHNDFVSCLSGNPSDSQRPDGERSLRDDEEPNSSSSAKPYDPTSLSDTRTCEQSKTQFEANESDSQHDNLLGDALLPAADASGLSVFKENLVDFGDSTDLESAVIRDKENAADRPTSSLVDELLIEQGNRSRLCPKLLDRN